MRVLCVGRHAYLSEHLCRWFGELGADCSPVVGTAGVSAVAAWFEPHMVIGDPELLTEPLLDRWSADPMLADTPVMAVSLTRRPDEAGPALVGLAGVLYLPALDRAQGLALLAAVERPRGVRPPAGAGNRWSLLWPRPSSATRR